MYVLARQLVRRDATTQPRRQFMVDRLCRFSFASLSSIFIALVLHVVTHHNLTSDDRASYCARREYSDGKTSD
jgi:hypothetical protein